MRRIVFLFCALISNSAITVAQADLSYYLPQDVTYNPTIPTPKAVIGYEIGEWHITHDKLVNYMYSVASASERVTISEYGRTYENRPLLLLVITSPENHQRINEIKSNHLKLTDNNLNGSVEVQTQPSIVWLGHSVHGNEASGANSSLITLYHFAAAQGDVLEKLLQETVILIDPSINPDGLNRFASWVNSHKSKNLVTDPNNLEQNEAWPRGRTNHYWFDLNRDYIPVQLPETKGRIAKIHQWKPNIYTDHHEMGTNSTFFFQPGVPSRVHPLIPSKNYTLTKKISNHFEEGLNQIQSFYFSRENYDDYYPGRGPTYVDFNGGIAILFEQASARSHAVESVNGLLTFPFAIRNHHRSALATVQAAQEMRVELLNYQREYYTDALKLAADDAVKAYVFGSEKDPARAFHLAEIVQRHDIAIYNLGQSFQSGNKSFNPGSSYIVPMNQNQYRLVHALFEIRNTFSDSLFYDVSAWTLPLAFNLEYQPLGGREFSTSLLGNRFTPDLFPKGQLIGGRSNYAYVFEIYGYYSHRAINRLLNAGVRIKVGNKPFVNSDGKSFAMGSILVPLTNQDVPLELIHNLVETIIAEDAIDVYSFSTGVSSTGPDLGSPSFDPVEKPNILILSEGGLSGYEVGAAWHLLDTRFYMKPSLVSVDRFNRINIDQYNTILLLDGNYGGVTDRAKEKLKTWVAKGGLIVATKRGSKWLSDSKISTVKFTPVSNPAPETNRYSDFRNFNGAQIIGGSIFKAHLDISHPLGWGFYNPIVPLFKRGVLIMNKSGNPFANPVVYSSNSLWSGYVPEEKLSLIDNSAAVVVSAVGQGMIISFTDDPNFRAFWYGTNKLFLNSIFFGRVINSGSAR